MEQDQPQQVKGTVEDLEIDESIKKPNQETNGASGCPQENGVAERGNYT